MKKCFICGKALRTSPWAKNNLIKFCKTHSVDSVFGRPADLPEKKERCPIRFIKCKGCGKDIQAKRNNLYCRACPV